MKAFRVRDVGHVDVGLLWKLLDGTAFVSVGGTNRSYLSVSPEAARNRFPVDREGVIWECDYRMGDRPNSIVLEPSTSDDNSAIVLVPSGAFDFKRKPLVSCGNAAQLLLLKPSETVEAYPQVRTLAEAERAKGARLHYDGNSVTFTA